MDNIIRDVIDTHFPLKPTPPNTKQFSANKD